MHKLLEELIPAPTGPIIAGDCICTCKKHVSELNQEVVASDMADTSTDVSVDVEDPPG